MKHFENIESLSKSEQEQILEFAASFDQERTSNLLEKKTLVSMFFNPSTRTRITSETAMFELGGNAISLAPGSGSWGIEIHENAVMDGKAEEHLKDAVKVISQYANFLGVRAFPKFQDWKTDKQDLVLKNIIKWSSIPVINLETITHPCQALSLIKTIRDTKKTIKKFVLSWAYHPKPLNTAVANSALVSAAMQQYDICLLCPPGFELDPYYIDIAKEYCKNNNTRFEIEHDYKKALSGADFVYVKSWGSLNHYGKPPENITDDFRTTWQIDQQKMNLTNDAFVSHCLPLRRNVLITDEVLDGKNSLIYQEAKNRLSVQKGILKWLNKSC